MEDPNASTKIEEKLDKEQIKKELEKIKEQCIFCKIARGEIPSHKIYEDDNFIVVLDIYPANEGHMLIIPKEHVLIFQQLPKHLIYESAKIIKAASHALLKALKVQGVNVIIQSGASAGQKSYHALIHIIPRYKDDGLFVIKRKQIDKSELEQVTKIFKKIVEQNKQFFE